MRFVTVSGLVVNIISILLIAVTLAGRNTKTSDLNKSVPENTSQSRLNTICLNTESFLSFNFSLSTNAEVIKAQRGRVKLKSRKRRFVKKKERKRRKYRKKRRGRKLGDKFNKEISGIWKDVSGFPSHSS